jgi:NADPH:quinone reductase-like Zn-dependent oxidoreductase
MFSSKVTTQSYLVFLDFANPITVHAASLNYRDLVIPKGKYPFPMELPVVPGSDGAGTVEAVGKGVTRFKPGGTHIHHRTQEVY